MWSEALSNSIAPASHLSYNIHAVEVIMSHTSQAAIKQNDSITSDGVLIRVILWSHVFFKSPHVC